MIKDIIPYPHRARIDHIEAEDARDWCEANCAGDFERGFAFEFDAHGVKVINEITFDNEIDATLFRIWVAGR